MGWWDESQETRNRFTADYGAGAQAQWEAEHAAATGGQPSYAAQPYMPPAYGGGGGYDLAGGGQGLDAAQQMAMLLAQLTQNWNLQWPGITGHYQIYQTPNGERTVEQMRDELAAHDPKWLTEPGPMVAAEYGRVTGGSADTVKTVEKPTLPYQQWQTSQTGMIDGQSTMARDQLIAALTGQYGGNPTMAYQQLVGNMTGQFNGSPTMAYQQWKDAQAQNWANLTGYVDPGSYGSYAGGQMYAGGTPGFYDPNRASGGQTMIGGGQYSTMPVQGTPIVPPVQLGQSGGGQMGIEPWYQGGGYQATREPAFDQYAWSQASPEEQRRYLDGYEQAGGESTYGSQIQGQMDQLRALMASGQASSGGQLQPVAANSYYNTSGQAGSGYGGIPTFARQQWEEAMRQWGKQFGLQESGVTGQYNGQDTMARQQWLESLKQWQDQLGLQQGQLTGRYNGQDTLARQQLLASQSGPRDWIKYQALNSGGGAFGQMQATPSWEQEMMRSSGYQPNGAVQQALSSVKQPIAYTPQAWNKLGSAGQQMQQGTWSAQGIDPNDAMRKMYAAAPTTSVAKTIQYR